MIRMKTRILNLLRKAFTLPGGESFLLAVVSGAELGSWRARLLPNHYQYPKPSLRRAVRHGITYDLDISDLVDWAIYFDLREAEQELMFGSVSPGATVFDVGANIGGTVMRFCQAVGEAGRVVAFEPDPANLERCRKNLALNEFVNHKLEGVALGREVGHATIYRVSERNPGMNRILAAAPANASRHQVAMQTLDSYVEEKGVERIDAIKVDVEGYETNVVKGAAQSIARFKPVLFLELCDANLRGAGSSAQELVACLEGLGGKVSDAKRGTGCASGPHLAGVKMEIICSFPS